MLTRAQISIWAKFIACKNSKLIILFQKTLNSKLKTQNSKLIMLLSKTAQLIPIQQLSSSNWKAMYALLSSHFEGVSFAIFEQDLKQKNWAILIEQNGILKGFSTLLIYQTKFAEETISVVYSGDTIVDPSAWSSSTLSKAWIASVRYLHQTFAQEKLYWLLIVSGYRTYRFLPIFWQEFYPCYWIETPQQINKLMDFLACDRFGENYNPETGIVRFPQPQILRNGLRGIPPKRLKDPHICFFRNQNPGHLQGDELVCLTKICEANLTSAGRRMWFADTDFFLNTRNQLLQDPVV